MEILSRMNEFIINKFNCIQLNVAKSRHTMYQPEDPLVSFDYDKVQYKTN